MGKTSIKTFLKKVPTGQRSNSIQSPNPVTDNQPSTSNTTVPAVPQAVSATIYVTYTDTTLKEWIGFNRSKAVSAGRHFKAQCIYCKLEGINGRKDALARHKLACTAMHIKKMVSHEPQKPHNEPPPPKTIPELMIENMELQDRSDWLLSMAIVTSDVSFR